MSGSWVKSLPPVMDHDDPRIYGEKALRNLVLALEQERTGQTDWLLRHVRYAAAEVRAWRLSMPKKERGERVAATGWMTENNRDLIHDAMKCIISADERDLFPTKYLRVAEADLRTLGKRLMKAVG